MKKLLILSVSLLAIIAYLIVRYSVLAGLCIDDDYECRMGMNQMVKMLSFAPLLLVVAAIAMLAKPKFFDAWWRFAWWGGPLTIGVIMLVNAGFHHTVGGFMNLSDIFDDEITLLAYVFFIVGSLVQIWRGYRTNK